MVAMVVASVASLKNLLHFIGWCPSKDSASKFDTLKHSLTLPRFLVSMGIFVTIIIASVYTLYSLIFPFTLASIERAYACSKRAFKNVGLLLTSAFIMN